MWLLILKYFYNSLLYSERAPFATIKHFHIWTFGTTNLPFVIFHVSRSPDSIWLEIVISEQKKKLKAGDICAFVKRGDRYKSKLPHKRIDQVRACTTGRLGIGARD
jgi:hypothetical protein